MTGSAIRSARRYKQLKQLQTEVCDALEKSDFAHTGLKNRSRIRLKTAVALMPSIFGGAACLEL